MQKHPKYYLVISKSAITVFVTQVTWWVEGGVMRLRDRWTLVGFDPIVRGPGEHSVIDGLHVARAEHVSKITTTCKVSKPGFFISNNLVNGNR